MIIDPARVHVTPGRFVFPRNDVGSQLPATRRVHQQQAVSAPVVSGVVEVPPVAAATIAPGTMPVHIRSMDINDMYVSYAHTHPGILHETAKKLRFRLTGKFRPCGGCSMSKGKRQPLRKTTLTRSERPLQRVFIDLAGPKPTQSVGGALYIMLIKDDFLRFGWTYFMKQKSDAGATFGRFLNDIRDSAKPSVVECVRSDGGGEFSGGAIRELCDDRGTRQEFTTPDTPQLNGVVERGLAIAQEAAQAACLEAPCLFPGVQTPANASL